MSNNIISKIQTPDGNVYDVTDKTSGYITINDVPKEIFWCTYGTTTYAEVTTALNAGKLPMAKDGNVLYVYSGTWSQFYTFSRLYNINYTNAYSLYLNSTDNSWSRSGGVGLERTSNKVTTISSSSTNTQYPSAKCVYDNIENVREVAEGKTASYVCSDVTNVVLNSQNDTITISSSLIDINSETITLATFNIGDVVYVTETDVPDRWVGTINTQSDVVQSVVLYKLETSKVPVTDVQVNGSSVVNNSVASIDLTGYAQSSNLAAVATSGDYDDLINKPTIPTDTDDLTNGAGYITSSALTDYVTTNTQQSITGRKRFDVTPQILDHYEITSKNLFRKNFNIFDNTGGTGSAYAYFKLPDDGKNYTLSVRLKDSTKSFGRGNVFGWTGNGGDFDGSGGWLAIGDTIKSEKHVFYANDTARFISLYMDNEATFNKLLERYYIQLEEGTTMTEYVDPDSGVENIYVNIAKVNDIPTNVSQLSNDSGYITSSYHDNTKANQSALNAVTDKIPADASASNQLADKDFVNSSIATATATFRGTYTVLSELQAANGDLNDYAFYQHIDSAGNTIFDRYKHNGTSWIYEYFLNNSSFTAAQWAAINSGVSAGAWVDMSTAQTINGQKNFNTVPTIRVESHKGAHNLPDEYQELQYISSSVGLGVINTSLAVSTDTYYAVIRASLINFTGNYGTIMGNNNAPQMAFNRTQWHVGNTGGNGQATSPAFNGTIYTLKYSYNGIGDYYVDDNDTGLRRTGNLGLIFFSNSATGAGDHAAANIYIAEIYRRSDDELIYQFIPARNNSSNQPGFYETVNNIFYSGVGISAGPEDQSGEVVIQYLPVVTSGNFASIAFSGNYNDLINKPTIPTVNNGTLTIQKNGTTVNTFTANSSSNVTANITVPTATSDLTNDSGYITNTYHDNTKEDVSNKVTSISSSSTDTQYPSAKCVYDLVGDIETLLTALNNGTGV